jgi:mannose-6-phosphate isomerase-like protein (cupin superfamily)
MSMRSGGHVVRPGEGRSIDLGVVSMRVLAAGEAETGGAFTLAEFSGAGAGPWTVPHVHRGIEESFFILDGVFSFTIGSTVTEATAGMYLLVPRATRHTITAAEGGGRLLTLMVPGGLEEMFFELGTLPPNAIRDPAARAAISARYDTRCP